MWKLVIIAIFDLIILVKSYVIIFNSQGILQWKNP